MNSPRCFGTITFNDFSEHNHRVHVNDDEATT